jgi:heme exporter protein D
LQRHGESRQIGGERRAVSAHALYVAAAYAITAVVLAGLIGWIVLDQRARRRELAELEAAGIRRRSDGAKKP